MDYGFVRAYMVDVDINQPVPSPIVNYFDGTNTWQHRIANWGYLGDSFTPSATNQYQGTLTSNLTPNASGVQGCNMARGRLRCENHYLPSADGTADKKPKLVK